MEMVTEIIKLKLANECYESDGIDVLETILSEKADESIRAKAESASELERDCIELASKLEFAELFLQIRKVMNNKEERNKVADAVTKIADMIRNLEE